MRNIVAAIGVLCVICLCCNRCMAGPYDQQRVAVLPFVDRAVIHDGVNRQIDLSNVSRWVGDLLGERREFDFYMVDREDIDKIIEEQSLNNSDFFDPFTASRFGKLVGAQYVAVGSLTGVSRKGGKLVSHVYVRIIEVETGHVYLSGRGNGVAEDLYTSLENAADDAVLGKRGILARYRNKGGIT